MRIIAGKYKNYRFANYKGNNTRPTTDMVKESIFNVLEGILEFNGLYIADIFAGTGNIGLEFLSRGAASVISIEHHLPNIQYIQQIKNELDIKNWDIKKTDAMQFVSKNIQSFDIVFADPPYDYPLIHGFVDAIISSHWFNEKPCLFILEHVDRLKFENKALHLKKDYGNTSFSIFKSI